MAYPMEGHDPREFWNAFHVLTRDLTAADTPAAAPANAPAVPAAPTPAADTPAPALPLLLPKLDPITYTPDEFAAMIAA